MTVTLPSVSSVKSVVPNPAWASLPLFDRTGWKRVRFGDVVENCNETCDPAEAGLERGHAAMWCNEKRRRAAALQKTTWSVLRGGWSGLAGVVRRGGTRFPDF